MKGFTTLIVTLSLAAAAQELPGWKLVWSEEFDKARELDSNVWNYETGFVRNHEAQIYTRSPKNVRIENGMLLIQGLKEPTPNPHFKEGHAEWQFQKEGQYSSGSINTRHKKFWQYGRLEVRAKLPKGTGMWPAIWMMGESKGWPACGEIDVMEHVGKEPKNIYGTIHWLGAEDKKHKGQGGHIGNDNANTIYDDFHTYGIEWDSEKIVIFYDDNKYFTYDISKADQPDGSNPFRQPHYLLINLAIGGSWGGPVVADDAFPATYLVDYIRFYQKAN